MKQKNKCEYSLFLALGSNLGERERNIEKAYKSIEKQIGRISSKSAFFYSAPEGFESKNNFLNKTLLGGAFGFQLMLIILVLWKYILDARSNQK